MLVKRLLILCEKVTVVMLSNQASRVEAYVKIGIDLNKAIEMVASEIQTERDEMAAERNERAAIEKAKKEIEKANEEIEKLDKEIEKCKLYILVDR